MFLVVILDALPDTMRAAAWLAVALVACCAGQGTALQLLVYPSGEWKVPEDTQHNLTVSLELDDGEVVRALAGPATAVLEVAALHRETWRLDWQRRTARFSPQEAAEGINKTLTFSGYYWGRTRVGLFLTRDDLRLTSPGQLRDVPPEGDLPLTWEEFSATWGNLNDTWGDAPPSTNLTLLNDVQVRAPASPVNPLPRQPQFPLTLLILLPVTACASHHLPTPLHSATAHLIPLQNLISSQASFNLPSIH